MDFQPMEARDRHAVPIGTDVAAVVAESVLLVSHQNLQSEFLVQSEGARAVERILLGSPAAVELRVAGDVPSIQPRVQMHRYVVFLSADEIHGEPVPQSPH